MTNIDKILFECNFTLNRMNSFYYLSGFNHIYSIKIDQKNIENILNEICRLSETEWYDYISDYNLRNK